MAPSGPPASAAPVAEAADLDPAAIERAYRTAAFVRINATPIPTNGAHAGRLTIYVDRDAAPRYVKAFTGAMPAGTTVVKVSEEEGRILAIMKKLPAGSDPAAGDWRYWERLGDNVIAPGQGGGLCNGCHQSGTATDRLLGTAVFAP